MEGCECLPEWLACADTSFTRTHACYLPHAARPSLPTFPPPSSPTTSPSLHPFPPFLPLSCPPSLSLSLSLTPSLPSFLPSPHPPTSFTTHKVSQARLADVIIVMAHGRLVEQGSHEQLVSARGPYWRLVSAGGQLSELSMEKYRELIRMFTQLLCRRRRRYERGRRWGWKWHSRCCAGKGDRCRGNGDC